MQVLFLINEWMGMCLLASNLYTSNKFKTIKFDNLLSKAHFKNHPTIMLHIIEPFNCWQWPEPGCHGNTGALKLSKQASTAQ